MRTDHDYLSTIAEHPAVTALADALCAGRRVFASGSAGSSTSLIAGAVHRRSGHPVVLIVAHLDDADEAVEELSGLGIEAVRFPALEVLPGETHASLDLFAERLAVLKRVTQNAEHEEISHRAAEHTEPSGLRTQDSGPLSHPTSEIRHPDVLVCPIQALMQRVPSPQRLPDLSLSIKAGEQRRPGDMVRWLDSAGYRRADSIEEVGDFAVRGGIIDIFAPGATGAVRLDFFGDEVESITAIDLETLGSGRRIPEVTLVGASLDAAGLLSGQSDPCILELLDPGTLAIVSETLEVAEQGRGYFERVTDAAGILGPPAVFSLLRSRFPGVAEIGQFGSGATAGGRGTERLELPARVLPDFAREAGDAVGELAEMAKRGSVLVLCQNEGEHQRLGELLREFAPGSDVRSAVGYLHRGFVWGDEGDALSLVPYHELLHRYQVRRRIRRLTAGARAADTFLEVSPGDYVVHADHGIARFIGLRTMRARRPKPTAEEQTTEKHRKALGEAEGETGGPGEEYLTLEFAGRSRLHVPVSQIDRVQRYVGGFSGKPPLSTLGGKRWQAQKDAVRDSVRDLAAELLRVQAARQTQPGVRFPGDTPWQQEFEAAFPYEETEDQVAALAEIKKDMSTERPMDRLLCGDVGYGKTELAIRAAFKAVEFGKQVAVLVPTTLLAEQHERTFRQRFADFPFRIESISRFKHRAEAAEVLEAARKGQVDILIGTHRLLSKDVRFADLALIVVDEEQRFGVEHKNALLALRLTVDVLTLSATPIPRTLHMAMLGLRDISSLATPPADRRAVVTESIPYNEKRIAQAIARELAREGQVFFVHNRVRDIRSVADNVQRLAPDARIVVGHGQMPDGELEEIMGRFVAREADILVSTTIVESGIDIPTANTMFINNADRFGLADLHQLRGRVGRYKHRAYCYLLLPEDRPVTDIAARRLRALEEFSMLGAGFKIAMRDLEIRGAGNLLGPEQSGHIAAVGYDMYCRLLEEAARELKSEQREQVDGVSIEIGVSAALPKLYIPSETRRVEAYRRLAAAHSVEQLRAVERDITEAYGEPPAAAQRAIDLAELRILAANLGVRAILRHEQDVIFRCAVAAPVAAALEGAQGTVRIIAKREGETVEEIYFRPPPSYLEPDSLLTVLRRRLSPSAIDQDRNLNAEENRGKQRTDFTAQTRRTRRESI